MPKSLSEARWKSSDWIVAGNDTAGILRSTINGGCAGALLELTELDELGLLLDERAILEELGATELDTGALEAGLDEELLERGVELLVAELVVTELVVTELVVTELVVTELAANELTGTELEPAWLETERELELAGGATLEDDGTTITDELLGIELDNELDNELDSPILETTEEELETATELELGVTPTLLGATATLLLEPSPPAHPANATAQDKPNIFGDIANALNPPKNISANSMSTSSKTLLLFGGW